MVDHTPPIRISSGPDNGAAREFERGYREHFKRLVAEFRTSGRETVTAEDLAQETLVRAFRSLPRFDATRPLWPWIKAIARCVAADHDRRPRPELPMELGDGPSIPAETARIDERGILDAARGRLTRRHDLAVRLRYIEDREPKQAAEFLGMTITAFNQLLFRARQRLREEYRRLSDGVPVLVWLRWRRDRCQHLGHRLHRTISRTSSRLSESADKLAGAAAVSFSLVLLPLVPFGETWEDSRQEPVERAAIPATPSQAAVRLDGDRASIVSMESDRSIEPMSAGGREIGSEAEAEAEAGGSPADHPGGPKAEAPEDSPPTGPTAEAPPAADPPPPGGLSPPDPPALPEGGAPEDGSPAVGSPGGAAEVELAPDPEEQAQELVASVEPLVGDPTQSIDADLIDP